MEASMATDTWLSRDIDPEAMNTPLPDSPNSCSSPGSLVLGDLTPVDAEFSESKLNESRSNESDYASIIKSLSSFLPHLHKVTMPAGIHDHANIDLYDYTSDGLKATRHYIFHGTGDAPAFQQKVIGNIPTDIGLRLVLV